MKYMYLAFYLCGVLLMLAPLVTGDSSTHLEYIQLGMLAYIAGRINDE